MHTRFALFRLLISLCSCAVAAGCHRPVPDPVIFPIELVGPPCGDAGPSVEILKARHTKCGKADSCTVLDQRIRNPANRNLWLLVDTVNEFSGYLESVTIEHERSKDSPPVWTFSGQNFHQAFNVPPGADIVVRGLQYHRFLNQYQAVFVHRVTLNHELHIDSSDPTGVMPTRGDFDMTWVSDSRATYDSKQLLPLEGKQLVTLGVWCAKAIPVSYDEPPTELPTGPLRSPRVH
jgi:hypothetical protein